MQIDGTGALWLNTTQATTTVDWVDGAATPTYFVAETLASTLDVKVSTTLAGTGTMPVAMQMKIEEAKTLTSDFHWISGRTVYDAGHQYGLTDATTGAYTMTGGTLVVTGTSADPLDLTGVSVGTLDLRGFDGTSFSNLWDNLTDHALLLNDTQASGNGFYATGNGGALVVEATRPGDYHDFSGIDASVNSKLVVSDVANMADAINGANDHTLLNVFTHVDLAFTGQLTVSADQASGITADHFIGTGGLYVRDDAAIYHNGAATLYGSSNSDTFVGGGYDDTVDLSGGTLTDTGGSDTIHFSTAAGTGHIDFTIDAFTTGGGAGHDVLDFSSLSAHAAHNGAGDVAIASLASPAASLGQEVIVVTDSPAQDASGVAAVFSFGNNLLNKALKAAGNTDAMFIMALDDPNDSGSGLPHVDFAVWHWHAAGGTNGYVHAGELTEVGILHGLDQLQIAAMTHSNVIG